MRNKSEGFSLLPVLQAVLISALTTIAAQEAPSFPIDTSLYRAMEWRCIGPFRGGRSTAVAGVPTRPSTFYFGSTGGGVWKTVDGGITWKNISDGYFHTGSVGAIAVAESDPNVVYVGMGEACVRGVASSHGDGVYRSLDGGQTWTHMGLEKTRQISTVVVHPRNPDLVYIAAQGSPWMPTKERGIYRSKDGGETWELVLRVDDYSGASDLSMDRTNPRILYAAFWDHQRRPWQIRSGGPGSGLYKSTDSGDTWEKLKNGLPELMGKTAVSVSPVNSERVWALVEAEKGGLFRSDNGGKSWRLMNKDRVLRARAWYYVHVFADTWNEETVYVLNAPMMKSTDGGKSFTVIPTPHGDNHALWINPRDHRIMINGNDGGANVSYNGGETWSTQRNQPTGQFYRVVTDNRFPYYVYGGQQDNSTVAVPSRTTGAGIDWPDWYRVSGCESAFLAFNPDNPVRVYGGCYQGLITVYNAETKKVRSIMAYEYLGLGSDPKDQKYRFNWNAPILGSPHDSEVIYHAGNVLLKTEDGGRSWEEISPDLTRNEKDKQGRGGGPITNEAAGGETYNTITYVVESIHQPGTIWTGSDDGLVHLTRDGGEKWINVTPPGVEDGIINCIEVSPHDPATTYIAVTRYKFNDFSPYIYKTENYGKSWKRIVSGIPEKTFVRVVREDPERRGLLYAGTETGLYISFNGGKRWQPFQLNLPIVPVTDLIVHNDDLIASTQGRAFWILDDLTPLHQINEEVTGTDMHLFKPRLTYRMDGESTDSPTIGKNPPNGTIIYYTLSSEPDSETVVKLEIKDSDGNLIRTVTNKEKPPIQTPFGPVKPPVLSTKRGMNRIVWDLRRETIERVSGLFTFGNPQGYRVAPGTYTASLTVGDKSVSRSFDVVQDPRMNLSTEDFREQQEIAATLYASANEIHESITRLRRIRDQIRGLMRRIKNLPNTRELAEAGDSLLQEIDNWEDQVVQTRQETFQDVINFPNKLNAQFIALLNTVDSSGPPVTRGTRERYRDLMAEWKERKNELDEFMTQDLPAFNTLYKRTQIPAVIVPRK